MRVRIRFAKLGKVRWTSHRDVARMWERAFRRVGFPLAYTSGFSPRPKVSFGLALPTGHESVAEYLDAEVAAGTTVDVDRLPGLLSPALPQGVDALAAVVVDPAGPSLQEDVASCTWRWRAVAVEAGEAPAAADMVARAQGLLDARELVVPRLRKGVEHSEDIRPGILDLAVLGAGPGELVLEADLAARPRSLRPADVVTAVGPGLVEAGVRRMHQWIWRDGARCEPIGLPSDATSAPHAWERAS